MNKIIKKQSISDQVYMVIKNSILNFKKKPGDKLNVGELCKQYEVSNTPVREAIKRLQQEGFVEQRVNVGFFITTITHEKSKEFSFAIKTIILGSIEELINNGQIEGIVNDLEKQLNIQKASKGEDSIKFLKEAIKFDEVFVRALKNKELIKCLERINEMFSFSVYNYHKEEENQISSIRDHQNMIQAIKDKKYGKLKELIREHYNLGTKKSLYFL